jgi:exonuclease V gamma subunit
MRLAEREFGCVANLAMPTLERYLWGVLRPAAHMRLLHVERFQQVLCALLDTERIALPGFAPIRAYLQTGDTIDPLKRVQLSARIAHQFLEYEYNRPSVWADGGWRRPGLDASWLAGRRYAGKDAADESWQKELYGSARERLANARIYESGQLVSTSRCRICTVCGASTGWRTARGGVSLRATCFWWVSAR